MDMDKIGFKGREIKVLKVYLSFMYENVNLSILEADT